MFTISQNRCSRSPEYATDRAAYDIVKGLIRDAADLLEKDAPNRAAQLRGLATHSFRHTCNTLMDEAGISRKHRKSQAGHSRDETSQIYEHAEDGVLHEQVERLNPEFKLAD